MSIATSPSSPAGESGSRPLPSPFLAVFAYTLRACLPAKRWFGVLLPCVGALLFGWLTHADEDPGVVAFADISELGLFRLILPVTCLIIGDAVLGADIRSGAFQLTWLSPVRFETIAIGRWLGGWVVALVTLVPALGLSAAIAGRSEAIVPIVVAGAVGSAAYLAVFVALGVLVRRSAVWALAVVLLGEWLLGGQLTGVAQLSPLWEAQQTFAGLWTDGREALERSGMPSGVGAIVRLAIITAAGLAVTTWRLRRLRLIASDD